MDKNTLSQLYDLLVNIDQETGIRYGVVLLHHLEDSIIDRLMIDENMTNAPDFNLEDGFEWPDEPEYEGEYGGVKYQIFYLGGAPHLMVLHSPHIVKARLCSPCIPNAGDLDSLDDSGCDTYGVPADWYYSGQ